MTRARLQSVVAVVFDMDGVLLDSEPLHFEAARLILAEHGVAFTEADNARFFGHTDLEFFRVLRARHGLQPDERDLAQRHTAALLRLVGERASPMAGVAETLRGLAAGGYRLALASSSERAVIETTLAALAVRHAFEVVVSGREVARGKPAPDIFLEAARRLGIGAERCLVVEDSRNGLLAAKAAGMACAVIPCPATRHEDFSEADVALERLTDLLPLLPAPLRVLDPSRRLL